MARRKSNKFNVSAPALRTWRHKTYASLAECRYAQQLEVLRGPDKIEFVREQPRLTLGHPLNVYVPDFLIYYRDGRRIFVDVKGAETAKFRKNKKLWAMHGPAPLHIVRETSPCRFSTTEIIPQGSDHEDHADGETARVV